jgi:hypothetical protein
MMWIGFEPCPLQSPLPSSLGGLISFATKPYQSATDSICVKSLSVRCLTPPPGSCWADYITAMFAIDLRQARGVDSGARCWERQPGGRQDGGHNPVAELDEASRAGGKIG